MLTPLHWNTLRALMNRIIPSDDFPNAWEAGVGGYFARQFELDLRPQLEMYQLGLEALEAEGHVWMGTGFSGLDSQAQDSLLSRIETGQVISSWPVDPAEFFHSVTEHVMEGYYSDPGNGGNRDSIAWRMIGFEIPE
jgi:Gluconate 2-dehydrogenase subunit 3